MAEYTTHYNLKKPAKNENYNIDVANQNNDIIDEKLYGKVDKKAGKDLSTNDFTNEYKKKLDTLKNYDDAEVIKQITSFNERAGKVEEANTEISKNVEALKTDNETNKTAISELKETTAQNSETITAIKEEQTTQNEKIEQNASNIEQNTNDIQQNKAETDEEIAKLKEENKLLKAQIPEGQASGNDIHLEDSSNMPFEWKINGESRQETRSGKNLFDNTVEPQFISNAKKEIINTGERIILTAKTFSYAIFKVEKNIREYAGTTVRLKMDFSKSNANLNPKYGVLLGSSDYSNRELKGESTVSGYTITFNLPSELENEKEYLFVRLYATQNNEGNIGKYVDYTKIILTIDNENMSYEAFGVSPSPKFPSKIENVENDVKMTVYNKNLASWDNKNISFENIISEAIEGNIIKTEGNEGIVNLAYSGGISRIKFSKKLKFGTQYTLSVKIRLLKQGKWSNQTQFFFGNKEKYSSEEQRFELALNTYVLCVFNFKPKLENEDVFTIYLNSNEIEIDLNTLQIEENTAATDYIQHEEQSIIFPLVEGQKLYEGSYLAKDGIHNNRISINGNEYKNTAGMNRAYSTENYNCFDIYTGLKFVKSENQYKTIGALCNQFKEKNWASFWQQKVNEEGFCINQDNRSTIYIKISKEICPDIDTFKKYIDENNLLFEIPLEQEKIIPYTPEQQKVIDTALHTYKNITNISGDNELATLDITYKKDIETILNNKDKEINERLSNIENLLNTTETSALLLDNLESDLEKEVQL